MAFNGPLTLTNDPRPAKKDKGHDLLVSTSLAILEERRRIKSMLERERESEREVAFTSGLLL